MSFICNTLKPILVIRADGSKLVGMGHLSRARLVANAFLKKGYEVRFLVKSDENANNFLKTSHSLPIIFLPVEISLEAECNLIHDILLNSKGVLVIDVLNHLDYCPLFDRLRLSNCVSAVIFDDDNIRYINSDVALNGSLFQVTDERVSQIDHQYLLGIKYFIMDPAYKHIVVRPPPLSIRDIFITVGGSDHNNLLFKLLNIFNLFGNKYNITIASSSASGYVDRLKSVIRNIELQADLHIDTPSLAKFWERADLAITSGGNSLFERVAAGLPGGTICQLDLQMKHAESFEKLGVNVNFGYGPELSEDYLFKKLKLFIDNRAEHMKQYLKMSGLINASGLDDFITAIEVAKKRLR